MKHAFLIIAHHQFGVLEKVLKTLDYEDVDFFIHIDKKAGDFPKSKLEDACIHSKLRFLDRMPVYWGGYSQIACTIRLLEAATQEAYDYYHLLSGADFPIKSKRYILDYFEHNPRYQYVHFERQNVQAKWVDRVHYHRLFQDTNSSALKCVNKVIRRIEKGIGYSRIRNNKIKEFQYGSQWFSITHGFAKYILSQKEWVRDTFKYARCGDELFVQTLLINSPFKDQLTPCAFENDYMACLRNIDWKRGNHKKGNPYVWQTEDYEALVQSPHLFARKFDLSTDSNIVDLLYEYCNS